MLSTVAKANLYLSLFGFFKVPLIWLCRPKIVELDGEHVVVKLPINRRNKNHLNSMYFGALCVGADIAGGFMAMSKAKEKGQRISLAFKAVEGQFLKRPEADVHFICQDGRLIEQMLDRALESGERINHEVKITATCPSITGDEVVADFKLTLSLKRRDR
ncbi:DUF4442 domain-containing protein [Vibrio sonorensis]|uniref:PaaI family thioesterase n=1 Tax=Vibrio sonorensis TaxID=1004316 RepID=UPI0008DA31AE|nr:DUF4442 domain-containing protein [Vibrio sonorensis]